MFQTVSAMHPQILRLIEEQEEEKGNSLLCFLWEMRHLKVTYRGVCFVNESTVYPPQYLRTEKYAECSLRLLVIAEK